MDDCQGSSGVAAICCYHARADPQPSIGPALARRCRRALPDRPACVRRCAGKCFYPLFLVLMYAEDVVVLQARKKKTWMRLFAAWLHFCRGPSKTAVMWFGPGRPGLPTQAFPVGGHEIVRNLLTHTMELGP